MHHAHKQPNVRIPQWLTKTIQLLTKTMKPVPTPRKAPTETRA